MSNYGVLLVHYYIQGRLGSDGTRKGYATSLSGKVAKSCAKGTITPFPLKFLPDLLRPNLLRPEIHSHCNRAARMRIVELFS